MSSDYFRHLTEQTNTRFWINNPTLQEFSLALDAGAVSCTTNPAYCARLIEQEPEYIRRVIDEAILHAASGERDEISLAHEVCNQVTKRLIDAMEPAFSRSGGKEGFVTLQEDPRRDQDTDFIVEMSRVRSRLGGNYMAKIPVIAGGIEAIQACVEEGISVCATEVFSISQAMDICEVYEATCARTGRYPAFFVTHISGIFDEYLGKIVICALNGAVAGASIALALACDLILASEKATFVFPFTRLGFCPDCGCSYLLTRLIGYRKTAELVLFGKPLGAEEAKQLGAINDTCPQEQLLPSAIDWAETLAAGPSVALEMDKALLRRAQWPDFERHLLYENTCQMLACQTSDFREGITAYREKRTPSFTGK